MTKNNERKSMVKGMIIDTVNQSFEQFEIETSYTRSIDKAVKFATAQLNADKKPEIVITVQEIVNEKTQRKAWNNAALYLESETMTFSEDEAKEQAKENQTIVKGKLYVYFTNVFYYDVDTSEYGVKQFSWSTGRLETAKDARAMICMRFEEIEKQKPIAIDVYENQRGYKRSEMDAFYIIDNDRIERCYKVANED